MKKILSLILIGLFLSLAFMNGVSATTTEEETTARNHGPFYVGSKPFGEYAEPGFVIGFYDRIDWKPYSDNISVRSLYSPHMLFGWNFGYGGPQYPFPFFFQIGAFASRVLFHSFSTTFVGIFTETESGFICGFVNGQCHFLYP